MQAECNGAELRVNEQIVFTGKSSGAPVDFPAKIPVNA